MSRLVSSSELTTSVVLIGAKARTLAIVAKECGHVPPFVAVPTTVVEMLWQKEEEDRTLLLEELVGELKALLPDVALFAVRSAALTEDQETSSQAGQFRTELAIPLEGIAQALWKVVQIGVMRLKGQAELFSCFIQVYKEADVSGVTFTRGPEGDPRLFVEYHFGRGEELVSGAVQPMLLNRFWGEEQSFALPRVTDADELLLAWKHLEAHFGHPQDIEWCVVKGEWFLLQARPITTISSSVYQGLLEADVTLPVHEPFLYEQTEIAELAPHPSQLTLSLLERLYAENGPITRAYASLGIMYDPRDFLSIVAGHLYVDREEELKTLLSSFTVLDPKTPGIPQKQSLFAPLHMRKLQRALASARVPAPIQLGRLGEALQSSLQEKTIEAWSQAFLRVYEMIFLTSLATQQELGRLDIIFARTTLTLTSVLSSQLASSLRLNLSAIRGQVLSTWVGNGLDIADTSPFVMHNGDQNRGTENETDAWWEQLPSLSRTAFEPVIRAAVQADQLREVGRWVTVCWMNKLRALIKSIALLQGLSETEAYQVRLEEWEEETYPSKTELQERKEAYERSEAYRLPSRLTNLLIEDTRVERGLSAGKAQGTLVTIAELSAHAGNEPFILLTEQLRPELAPFLSRATGILTARGGMLSHLAILAREQSVPVISGVSFKEFEKRRGEWLTMDADKGTVEFQKQN